LLLGDFTSTRSNVECICLDNNDWMLLNQLTAVVSTRLIR
jgi:hypothetical protein